MTQERRYEPIPYKQLKDLVAAVKDFGATADYSIALLRRICVSPLTPQIGLSWAERARLRANSWTLSPWLLIMSRHRLE